jgi:hypothetical protein
MEKTPEEKKKILMSCAGAWKDLDTDKMIEDIYRSRKVKRRREIRLT